MDHVPGWLVWLVAAVVLAGAEAVSGDLVLVMLAGGALAGGATQALTGDLLAAVVVAAVASTALLLGVRPYARRRLLAGDGGLFGIERLSGRDAVVSEVVDGGHGRVRIDGQEWSARSLDPSDTHPVGEVVKVAHIDGATAVVWHHP